MSSEEIVRTYGNRWSIELFFRASKSLLDLGSEFQGLSYDMTVSSTAIVFTRYILIEWLRRKKNDQSEEELIGSLKDDYIVRAKALSYIVDAKPQVENDVEELQKIAKLMCHILNQCSPIKVLLCVRMSHRIHQRERQ